MPINGNVLAPLFLILIALTLVACTDHTQERTPSDPPEVDVAQLLTRPITEWNEFAGRFEAVRRVDVRARVTGYLVEKHFRDGQFVTRGDVLFIVDPRAFQYELQRAEAQFELAQKEYRRASDLSESRALPREELDRREQQLEMAEAALLDARLALEFTRITAPIDGRISENFTDVGNLVRENETVLTRIVSVDPIHFEFDGSQTQFLEALRLDREGKRPSSSTSPNPIFIKLVDEDTFGHMGRMQFIDNVVDAGTGTIRGRALIQNPQGIIYPGMFGRARLNARLNQEVQLVPERAINTDQSRKFVYVVDSGNQVRRAYVEPGPVQDNGLVIIRSGLAGDEWVVVRGLQRIRSPEQIVSPVQTRIEWAETDVMPDPSSVPSLEAISGPDNAPSNTGGSQ